MKNDEELVTLALQGKKEALETLIQRYQDWIYNIALRMTGTPEDAEDVTQEVLLIIITKLSTFQERSKFSTWVYRIVANHVINMKKRRMEMLSFHSSFIEYGRVIKESKDMEPPDPKTLPIDLPLLMEEIKTFCMMGMLLCLDRKQRLVFILGHIFGISSSLGARIFEITEANFRKKLSRARQAIFGFMKEKCGLVEKDADCKCENKAQGLIHAGAIDPKNLQFCKKGAISIRELCEKKQNQFSSYVENQCSDLFREQAFLDSPKYEKSLLKIVESRDFKDIFNMER